MSLVRRCCAGAHAGIRGEPSPGCAGGADDAVAVDEYCLHYVGVNEMSAVMKCSACGNEVRSDARFCSHCGARTKVAANTGVSPYELPWDAGQAGVDTPDFHAEDTIIPDFMPPTPAPADTVDDVFAGVAQTVAPAAGAVTGNAAASTGRKRVLAAALLVLLLAAGSFYLFSAAGEAPVPAPETAAAVQPDGVPVSPELHAEAEAEATAKAEETVALAPPASTDEAVAQPELTPASPPDPVVEPEKPAPRAKSTETVQRKAAPAQPAPAPRPASPAHSWLASLKADLAACDAESFFPRIACREKARWKYCAPERWNTVPECEVDSSKR